MKNFPTSYTEVREGTLSYKRNQIIYDLVQQTPLNIERLLEYDDYDEVCHLLQCAGYSVHAVDTIMKAWELDKKITKTLEDCVI